MKYPHIEQKTALITGCSSGIGLATAKVLRDNGWRVFPTVRKSSDFEMLKSLGFSPLYLDLNDSDSIKNCVSEVMNLCDGKLGAVVNNAGFGQPGAIEDLTRSALRQQFETNLFGLVELTNLILPAMKKAGCGRVVNVASVLGQICMPFNGAYSASKFALEAISDAQRVELSGTGIAVSIIEPGPIATQFSVNAHRQGTEQLDCASSRFGENYKRYFRTKESGEKSGSSLGDGFRKPPEAVAQKVLHALESAKPKIRYPVTTPAYFGHFLRRFCPAALIDRFFINYLKKASNSN